MESAYDAFQEGARLLASDNPHAAVIPLETARDLEPDKASIRETLARAYFRCGRFGAAAAEFAQVVEIEPVNDYAHFGLGLCLIRRDDRIGARRHLKLAVAMRPDREDYRDALARVVDTDAHRADVDVSGT
jgi:Flp pilus assembly protein TadD